MSIKLYPLTVKHIQGETEDAYTISFQQPEDPVWNYQPGQFLTLEITIEGETHRRAFSLSSSPPTDTELRVTIKRIPLGKVSGYLWSSLRPGDQVMALPPMGNFILPIDPEHRRHYILIGAGSGITPLMSMLKAALALEPESKVTLWYGNRKENDIIFKDELIHLKDQYQERLTVIHVLSQPGIGWKGLKGRLDEEQVYELILDLFMIDEYKKRYFICGPEGMMESVRRAMDKHAIDPLHVFQEYYHTPLDRMLEQLSHEKVQENGQDISGISPDPHRVKIHLNDEWHQIEVKPEQSILDAALEHGLDAPYSCKGGICTTCKALCTSGKVGMKVDMGLSEQDKEDGYILTCQAFPLGEDVEIAYD